MRVHGIEITEHQINEGIRAMRGTFRAATVTQAFVRSGVPNYPDYTADRAADRLLQKMRRLGKIRTNPNNKREWQWCDDLPQAREA